MTTEQTPPVPPLEKSSTFARKARLAKGAEISKNTRNARAEEERSLYSRIIKVKRGFARMEASQVTGYYPEITEDLLEVGPLLETDRWEREYPDGLPVLFVDNQKREFWLPEELRAFGHARVLCGLMVKRGWGKMSADSFLHFLDLKLLYLIEKDGPRTACYFADEYLDGGLLGHSDDPKEALFLTRTSRNQKGIMFKPLARFDIHRPTMSREAGYGTYHRAACRQD